ncbi:MAG TPA: RNA polymerase subunit sigma-70, partial [Mollicutes bacterium]|nr:RNA polymerase subunit sigma-70 [Mollicutes bacterium]
MFFSFLTDLIKNMLLTGSYSNNVFPDPLSKEDEL